MRIRIKLSCPANLNLAICLAVELDALYNAEKNEFGRAHIRGATGTDEAKRYKDNMEDKLESVTSKRILSVSNVGKKLTGKENVKNNSEGDHRQRKLQ